MRALGVLFGIIGIAVLTTFFGSWFTVGQGERGVVTRFGAVVDTAEPGLGFKTPFITGVTTISIQTQLLKLEKEEAYSFDQQAANMHLSVNYRIIPGEVEEVYTQFRNEETLEARLITPRVRQQLKNIFGQYTAATIIKERDKLNTQVREAIQASMGSLVEIEGVQLEDLKFSKGYEDAIEQRMLAEVEVTRSQQKVQNEVQLAKIKVTQAQADADSRLAVAKANAEATRIQGEAEAEAIRARGAALKDNPSLVDLTAVEKWKGDLPTTMVPGASVPFLGVR